MKMFEKLKSAKTILKERGLSNFVSFIRQRLARDLAGNKLSNYFPIMGFYQHPDGEMITLYACYRDYLKPVHFLAHTHEEGYQLYLRGNGEKYVVHAGLNGAMQFLSFVTNDLHIDVHGKKILDVGCGDGALVYLLAAKGADEVHGIDADLSVQSYHLQYRELFKKALIQFLQFPEEKVGEIEKKIKIFQDDIQSPQINDRFDIIFSNSVLEHIRDLKTGLRAMRELLNTGGIMVHKFNPFYSETGGHEFCILDFPWGHVRLSLDEIAHYLETYRAWEKDKALEVFDRSFNQPKLTLQEIDEIAQNLDLKCLFASEKRTCRWKPDSPPSHILSQCRRTYPNITWRDLMSDSVTRAFLKL